MDSLEPAVEVEPVRVEISDSPPRVMIGPEGEAVDFLPSIERAVIDLLPSGVYVTLTMRADVKFDFEVKEVREMKGGDLDGLTVEELKAVIVSGDMLTPLEERLFEHLRNRSGSRA